MKGIFIIIFFAINCFNMHAQYKPFNFENGIWLCSWTSFDDFGSTSQVNQYYCDGKAIIEGKEYYKLYSYRKMVYGFSGGGSSEGKVYQEYIGEINNFDKTVRFISADNGNETIIYDFNLSVGDTIVNGYGGKQWSDLNGEQLVISEIDSVDVCGEYHKRYIYNDWMGAIIEGIGSEFGLIDPSMIVLLDAATSLQCYTENEARNCNDCELISSIDGSYKVSPAIKIENINGQLIIKCQQNINEINIYNFNGMKIFHGYCIDKNYVDVSSLHFEPNQIVFVQLITGTSNITGKIYMK